MTSERFSRPVPPSGRPGEVALRATARRIAAIERPPCSPGEREAAHLIADRLRGLGAAARVEEVPAYGSYAWPLGGLTGLAALAGLAGARSRTLGVAGGAVAALGVAGELTGGHRLARAVLGRRRTACNVVAEIGDPAAPRTLVVMAHHDAAGPARVLRRASRRLPVWWPVVAGPVLVALGAALRRPSARVGGAGLCAVVTAALADLGARRAAARGRGDGDGPAGVAVLVALADAARLRPLHGLRVVLVSAGADAAWQEGARGFACRHLPRLPRASTWFLVLDGLGTGDLTLLGAEGRLLPEPYDAAFGDLIARCAAEEDLALGRLPRVHGSSAGTVPLRAGYPAACLTSSGTPRPGKTPADPTEPAAVDYRCLADAAQLTDAVARTLAAL
ncbi:peptidase M28 [Actinomadura rubrisoli]|uniref:Peptidase M28 n=1 Tax=Actinomadura rubrisoli TaxID=2530368 RepID=A0A4R5BF16_9ACTN|nr:peptidase M28 [Actinomadura rubrisoli]TDD85148.1 peptidase M28 [Actinomadura rubrisoli]